MRIQPRGFTLIELIVIMVVTSGLFAGFLFSTNPLIDLWTYHHFYQGAALEGKLAVMRMGREISQIENPQGVLAANASTFSFRDAGGSVVTYSLNSGTLERNNRTLAEGVTSLQFQYWNKNQQAITSPVLNPSATDLRRVGITVTVASGTHSFTVRAQVAPRNVLS